MSSDMGSVADPRKEFIHKYDIYVSNCAQ